MIVFLRTTPFPKCRHCGKQLDFWIPGLSDEKHSHPACEGAAMAKDVFDQLRGEKVYAYAKRRSQEIQQGNR
jgi:hypothetical protein